MDNDFNSVPNRPMGQPLRRPPVSPRPLQPRPQTAPPVARPMQPTQLRPATQPSGYPQQRPTTSQQGFHTAPAQQQPQQLRAQTPQATGVPPTTQPLPEIHHDTVPPQPQERQFTPPPKKRRFNKKKFLKIAMHVVIVLLLVAGGWLYYSYSQKQLDKKDAEIATLTKNLGDAQALASGVTKTGISSGAVLTQDDKNQITAAINSGNYAAIQNKLGEPVLVVVAGSDGYGRRSATQAVNDLAYLKTAKQPWNFNLSEETLTKYSTGKYAQYFPDSAIVGQSADNKVVSLILTPAGKIGVIFMAESPAVL